jgi:hypothetical protein
MADLNGKLMTRLRVLFVCGLVILAGCSTRFETNQQACERLFDYFRFCVPEDGSVPPGIDLDELFALTCALVPEDGECNFSAVTDCMIRNTNCDTIGVGAPPAACVGIAPACVVGAP